MFAWYWLADLCEDEAIPFTLGHALYMKAMRGGMFPMAYVYPRIKRATRDLLRRRRVFVNRRSQLRSGAQSARRKNRGIGTILNDD